MSLLLLSSYLIRWICVTLGSTEAAPLPSVSTPTLFHPSVCSVTELLKDLDKADLLPCSWELGCNWRSNSSNDVSYTHCKWEGCRSSRTGAKVLYSKYRSCMLQSKNHIVIFYDGYCDYDKSHDQCEYCASRCSYSMKKLKVRNCNITFDVLFLFVFNTIWILGYLYNTTVLYHNVLSHI